MAVSHQTRFRRQTIGSGPTRRGSLRTRTTIAATLIVAIGLLLAAASTVAVLRRSLEHSMSKSLLVRARNIAVDYATGHLELGAAGEDEPVAQVVGADNTVLRQSTNLRVMPPIVALHLAAGRSKTLHVRGVAIRDEQHERFLLLALGSANASGPFNVLVANNLDQVDETVARLRFILRTGLPFLLALVSATIWVVVGIALRPVGAIRRQVSDITERDLNLRVPDPGTDDEIGRLARGMNEMLSRLHAASDRQNRFVADASHELQSPLASSLADLDIALAHPDSIPWTETAAGLLADNQRMTRLVQDLLFLARADSAVDAATVGKSTVLTDVDEVIRNEIGRVRLRTHIPINSVGVQSIEYRTQPDLLGRVVRNLLENAIRYAVREVRVELERRDNHEIVLVVHDDGPGIPADDRERIFERFTRLDQSRSRETGGTGLGLAIAREIVHGLHGTIGVEDSPVGARFVVCFPAFSQ